jgi:predicted RNA-binding protein Jag
MLAYTLYLNFSVFTKRQMTQSKKSMIMYEDDDYEERRESMLSTLSQRAMGVKVNLVYLVFKIR